MKKTIFNKKKNLIYKILGVVFGVVILGILVYVISLTPVGEIFSRGQADRAFTRGKIEISSARDIGNYFVFLPQEKVKNLLQESEGKFLFPQVDIGIADAKNLVITTRETSLEGSVFNFLTISGLPLGTKIYSSTGGFIRGGIMQFGDNAYAWVKESWAEEGNHDVMLTYIPVLDTGMIENPVFTKTIDEVYQTVNLGVQYASILTENTLPEEIVPGGVNIAVAIAGEDSIFTKLSLANILIYEGRIVMVERQ